MDNYINGLREKPYEIQSGFDTIEITENCLYQK